MSVFRARQPIFRLTAVSFALFGAACVTNAQDNPLIPAPIPGITPPPAAPPAPPKPTGPPPAARQAAAQFQKAIQLQKSGRVTAAISAYREFLRLLGAAKIAPRAAVPAYGNLAMLYAATGQRQAQGDALRHLLAIDGKNAQALSQLALLDMSLGRTKEGKTEALRAAALTQDPKIAAVVRYTLGNAAMMEHNAPEAVQQYTLALKAAPNSPPALLNRCIAYQQLKRYKEALADARQARALIPNDVKPRAYIAALYEEQHDLSGTIGGYKDALRVEPRNPYLLFHLAAAQQQAKKFQDSIDSYTALVKIDSAYYPAQLNLGELYYERGNYADARVHFAAAVKHGPNNAIPPLLGLSLSEVKIASALNDPAQKQINLKNAETHLKSVLAVQPDSKQAQNALLYVYQLGGRNDAAITLIEKRLAKKPDDLATVRQLAAQYQLENKPDDAVKVWRDYRTHAPNDPVSYQEAANLLQGRGKNDEALQELNAYLLKRPDDAAMQISVAQTLAAGSKREEARKAYNAVLRLDTTGAKTANPKAKEAAITAAESSRLQALQGLAFLAQQDNKWDEAIQYWSQAKALQAGQAVRSKTPPNVTAYRAIGYAYEQLKKYDLAEREYQSLAQAAPSDTQVNYELARVYDAEDKRDEAIAAYRKAAETEHDKLNALLQIPALYHRKNDNDKAAAEYAELFQKYPADLRLLSPYAQFAVETGRDNIAADIYAAIVKADPQAHWAESQQAAALTRLKRYAEARTLYEAAAARTPDSLPTYNDIKKVYGLENKPDDFLVWLQTRLDKNPASRAVMGYFVQQYAERKRGDDGMQILKTIVAKHDKETNVLEAYASLLTQRGKGGEAVEVYRQIAALNPGDMSALIRLIDAQEAGGRSEDAIKYLESASAFSSASATQKQTINDRLARLYEQHGKPEKAITIYENTLTAPNTPPAMQAYWRNRIAALYEKINDKPNAVKQYREALKINPTDPNATQSLKRLGEKL